MTDGIIQEVIKRNIKIRKFKKQYSNMDMLLLVGHIQQELIEKINTIFLKHQNPDVSDCDICYEFCHKLKHKLIGDNQE